MSQGPSTAESPFGLAGPLEVIAHRGYSARAPENTLAAMSLAIAVGADAVEFDLQTAADGTAYLFHDAKLDRTSDGSGPLRDRTPEELGALDAGSWFDAEFSGEPIPSLRRAADALRGRVGRIYAEVKGYRDLEEVDRILTTIEDGGLLTDTCFISMEWAALARIRERRTEARIGYIVDSARRVDEGIERARGDRFALLDFDCRLLLRRPARAERARGEGIELATWTVDEPADAALLLDMGVPRITTNEVEAMLRWKETL